ncbi:MAG: hypothetical protein Q7S00_02250 [bacterium]|nr:hypothetical protein [bacterium]
MKTLMILLALLLMPFTANAFSQKFVEEVTTLQSKILLDGVEFNERNLLGLWERFDDEILEALDSFRPTEKALNEQFAWTNISAKRSGNKLIRLGAVEAKFYSLADDGWLVTYYFGYGTMPASTFRIFKKQGLLQWFQYSKVYSFEQDNTLPEQDKLQWSSLEVEKSPEGLLSTYHLPSTPAGGKANRLRIDWQWKKSQLKGIRYNPTVDWHKEKGKIVSGPGEMIKLK